MLCNNLVTVGQAQIPMTSDLHLFTFVLGHYHILHARTSLDDTQTQPEFSLSLSATTACRQTTTSPINPPLIPIQPSQTSKLRLARPLTKVDTACLLLVVTSLPRRTRPVKDSRLLRSRMPAQDSSSQACKTRQPTQATVRMHLRILMLLLIVKLTCNAVEQLAIENH